MKNPDSEDILHVLEEEKRVTKLMEDNDVSIEDVPYTLFMRMIHVPSGKYLMFEKSQKITVSYKEYLVWKLFKKKG